MAIIKKYRAEVISVINSIEGVYTVEFRSLDKPFRYDPGQFLHLAIDRYDPAEQWPDSRCFSMQTSPEEELIRITYAVKGSFTKQMQDELKPGKEVSLKMPYGDLFMQPHSKTNSVFIAGGTGITPFLSLFNHSSFKEYINPKIYLGFRSEAYNIYKNELKAILQYNPISFHEDSVGIIDIGLIFKDNGRESTYFISGPPLMINNFRSFLLINSVPNNHIITDDWE